ncbi:hypothetical protein N7462_000561 [Penicillium macrosclerotiorum]|uniref:uncharacterized protein n=1 Tax=Penicillium macrosclerotiorum TaxID=303699 RepID=UPI0025475262|nr:uncharacterized protein N7462_000561 [Penicillium macrosclerotiorum]KAJ5698556.1 hypothetical protein N7462_000561 [Penicillium macrosclerotiorum]
MLVSSKTVLHEVDTNDKIFAQDRAFWKNYNSGRPQVPQSFFQRIYDYHLSQNGGFDIVHDAGAGNGVHSQELRSKFHHVIISDVAPDNVRQAEERLGSDGYSYHQGKMEEIRDILPGSVDMVFVMNAMHWADQEAAIQAIATQLKPGGTFACAGFGPALFNDRKVQDVWERISQQGGRVLLKTADQPIDTLNVMARSQDLYNVAPLDERLFRPGARRIHLNMENGGLTGLLPPERQDEVTEPDHTGPRDLEVFERDEEWGFEMDLDGFKEHFRTFPHAFREPEAFTSLWQEVEDLLQSGSRLDGYWPATLILATRGDR